jgi:hypothetical protein
VHRGRTGFLLVSRDALLRRRGRPRRKKKLKREKRDEERRRPNGCWVQVPWAKRKHCPRQPEELRGWGERKETAKGKKEAVEDAGYEPRKENVAMEGSQKRKEA